MIFGKKSCAPSDGFGFRQGQNIVHNVCGRKLGLIVQMAVDVRRGADVAVTQPLHDLRDASFERLIRIILLS